MCTWHASSSKGANCCGVAAEQAMGHRVGACRAGSKMGAKSDDVMEKDHVRQRAMRSNNAGTGRCGVDNNAGARGGDELRGVGGSARALGDIFLLAAAWAAACKVVQNSVYHSTGSR